MIRPVTIVPTTRTSRPQTNHTILFSFCLLVYLGREQRSRSPTGFPVNTLSRRFRHACPVYSRYILMAEGGCNAHHTLSGTNRFPSGAEDFFSSPSIWRGNSNSNGIPHRGTMALAGPPSSPLVVYPINISLVPICSDDKLRFGNLFCGAKDMTIHLICLMFPIIEHTWILS